MIGYAAATIRSSVAPSAVAIDRRDDPLPDHRGRRERDDRAVDGGVAPEVLAGEPIEGDTR